MTGNGHDTTSGDDERVSESPVPDVPMTRTPEVSVQMSSQLHSPPQDTQPFSHCITPTPYRYEGDDEFVSESPMPTSDRSMMKRGREYGDT